MLPYPFSLPRVPTIATADTARKQSALGFDAETLELMRQIESDLLRNSKPLEPEFQKIINENWLQMLRDN